MIAELRNEIFRIADAVGEVNGKLYYGLAPQETALPYYTFQQITNPTTRDTTDSFEEVSVQFNAFGKVLSDLESDIQALKDVLDLAKAGMSVTGYSVMSVVRNFSNDFSANQDGVWQLVTEYRFKLQKL